MPFSFKTYFLVIYKSPWKLIIKDLSPIVRVIRIPMMQHYYYYYHYMYMDIFIKEIFYQLEYSVKRTTAFAMQYLFVLRHMRNHKQILCDNIVQSCDPAQCPKT